VAHGCRTGSGGHCPAQRSSVAAELAPGHGTATTPIASGRTGDPAAPHQHDGRAHLQQSSAQDSIAQRCTHQLQQVDLEHAAPLLHRLRREGGEPALLRELEHAQLVVALLQDLQRRGREGRAGGRHGCGEGM